MPVSREKSDVETSTDPAPLPPIELLLTIGRAVLGGTSWEIAFSDPRWAERTLYIAYTHDKLGTPDTVEGVFFERLEAEALAAQVAQRHNAANPMSPHFLRFRIIEWPLTALAMREARDGFHHEVVRHIVAQIKIALDRMDDWPDDFTAVSIGSSNVEHKMSCAWIDATGEHIVLWEDCCQFAESDQSLAFMTQTEPPRCGLMNALGEIIVPAAFDEVAALCEGLAVARRNGKSGYVDAGGATVIPFIFEDAADCCQNVLLVKTAGLWGAIDRDGKELIPPRYDLLIHDIGNEAIRATLNGRHSYLSQNGQLLVGYSEQSLLLAEHSFAAGRAVFIAHDDSGSQPQQVLVDALGRRIGMRTFAAIRYGFPDEGLLCAKTVGTDGPRYGYINMHGDTVIPFRFAQAGNFAEGLAAAAPAADARYGYIDRCGNWQIPPRFWEAGEFHEGLANASGPPYPIWLARIVANQIAAPPEVRRHGYIDRCGKWVVAPRFLETKPFSEGMAAVRLEQGWGYVNVTGRVAIACQYQEAGLFMHGVARVARRFDGPLRWGLIDCCGRQVIPLRFDWLSYPRDGLITACDEFGMWGCFSLFGNIVVPFIYRDTRDLEKALAGRGA